MKSALFSILLVLTGATSALAQANLDKAQNCLGEAQIIATVESVGPVSSGLCRANVSDVRFFAENQTCPLSLADVVEKGILVRADNFQCMQSAGSEISGVIVLKADGSIRLE
ncbi:MAG: hypothetical protein AABZ31_09090 [Bdellovibrionota bacterium]